MMMRQSVMLSRCDGIGFHGEPSGRAAEGASRVSVQVGLAAAPHASSWGSFPGRCLRASYCSAVRAGVVSSGAYRHQVTGERDQEPTEMPRVLPSTNLAEISDWLTKLLLGAGLVSLTRLGRPLSQLIDNVARGLGGGTASGGVTASAAVLAGAILITYVVLGFLGGYLTTAFFYGRVLQRR